VSYAIYITAPLKNNPYVGFLGALLGGIITLAPFSYINFVVNPYLEISWNSKNEDDTYRPSLDIPRYRSAVKRKHIRVVVRNVGQKAAKSCCATVRIEENGRVDGCSTFSSEPKDLKWVTPLGDIETAIDIAPHGGEQHLEIIFADNYESYSPEGGNCKIDQMDKAPLWAYASTPPAYDEPRKRNQDGFCKGRFRVDLTVYSETAKPCRKKFELNISGRWEISMSDKWNETLMSESDDKTNH
jgi:hypothetical protein